MNLARRILMARRMCDAPDCDPYWDDVVLLLKGDGPDGSTNIIDSSINNHPVTVHGNAQISTAQSAYPDGSSMYFDGDGARLLSPDSLIMRFSSKWFTVELSLFLLAVPVDWSTLVSKWNSPTRQEVWVAVGTDLSVTFGFGPYSISALSEPIVRSAPGVIGLGEWAHIAAIRNDNTFLLTVNGVIVGAKTVALGVAGGDSPLIIGSYVDSSMQCHGYIDELRITKGVARYTTSFTPPTEPFPTTGP